MGLQPLAYLAELLTHIDSGIALLVGSNIGLGDEVVLLARQGKRNEGRAGRNRHGGGGRCERLWLAPNFLSLFLSLFPVPFPVKGGIVPEFLRSRSGVAPEFLWNRFKQRTEFRRSRMGNPLMYLKRHDFPILPLAVVADVDIANSYQLKELIG